MLLAFTAPAFAEEEIPDPPPPPKDMPAGMRCYQLCINSNVKCQKGCKKNQRCVGTCTKQLKECSDACGGPPVPQQ